MRETGYIPGERRAVCDSCGFEFLASQLKKRWDGMMVCDKDWETRHPQEFVRGKPEKATPDWSRPAEVAEYVTTPSVPASGVDETNSTGVAVVVFISGGAVSNVTVGGTAKNRTFGFFDVPSGDTISITYTVAPTWTWHPND